MNKEDVTVTLTYPDGAQVSFRGRGAVVYTSEEEDHRLFAVTGRLTLGDAAQLILELMDSFGDDDVMLAASLALVSRRMEADSASFH